MLYAADWMQPDPQHIESRPPTGRWVTTKEAAELLSTTIEAIRARVKRGTLRKDKGSDGTVYIWIEAEQQEPGDNRTRPDGDRTSDQMAPDASQRATHTPSETALVEALRDQVEMLQTELRSQVAVLRDELVAWQEEARRKDAIIMAMAQRIPELPPPRESPVTASEDAGRGRVPPEQETADSRSWWRRIFNSSA